MRLFHPLQPPTLQHGLVNSNYRYREYFPSKSLESYIACYWTVEFNASHIDQLHRIIPDGCVDIIFDLKSPSLSKGAFATGLMTQFEVMNLSQNCSLFGIRFFIDTAHLFFTYPVSEFIGNQVFLEDIWGNDSAYLVEDILSSSRTSEIIEKIESTLLKFLLLNEAKKDDLLETSMQYMFFHKGMVSIRSLSEELSFSERHIRRRFQKEFGVSPKELVNIIRFQNLLQELYLKPQLHLSELSLKYGYYDQPHFIKSFKHLYGLSPSKLFTYDSN
ncbi:AraC-like DNA-binding protein [Bacillus pakistanensis]|uniref:AraC-like DNA-binding protein n=1 Tax=Rossellomorea pakistanensis TaxID=992288 RepID=A0ABS2NCA5_9BACI|nr:response regulator transcription factor [Bacillus pakistanensis]MBM7585445.1 AraC-like DNA-binding protein [Bacillus pakistanensis]